MANRCPDCNRFVGLEAGDPEAEDPQIDDAEVMADVRVVLNCAECGSEMSEWQVELRGEIPQEALDHLEGHEDGGELVHCLEVQWETEPEVSDAYRSKKPPVINKKTGKPRPVPFRFQTHYYSVNGTVQVYCTCGEENIAFVELFDEIEASGFESTV